MYRLVRLSLVLAPLTAVAACGSGATPFTRGEVPTVPVRTHANYVELAAHAEYVAFDPGAVALTGARLDAFRARLSPVALGRDHLVLVAPAVPGDRLSEARAEWALAALQGRGVSALPSAAPLQAPAGSDAEGGVVLEVQQARVAVPDCEVYPRALYAHVDEAASGRLLGCANTANLGLMVADPVDLVHGRTLAPAEGGPAAQAVAKYRTAGAKSETTNPIAEAFAKAFGGKDK